MSTHAWTQGLVFQMFRGPFQNNGATPWYSPFALGTPGQPLKWAIDSGTNITWTTSTLCPPDQCQHFSKGRFDYQRSSTFAFTDCLQRPYSFGPWGTMQVATGSDALALPNGKSMAMNLLLAANYSGKQFRQLDWDGGIGLPSSSAYVEGRSSFLFQELIRNADIDPTQPYVCFDWDPVKQSGTCAMGTVDESKTKGEHLFLPWSVYSKFPGVEYIWSSELSSYAVGGEILATDISFALDSGSWQFKGDDTLMKETLERIARDGNPDVVLGFAEGEITLGANLYNVLIEAGPQKGQTIPQFAPLGLTDLVLVGSLVMEHCYTIHEYKVVQCSPTVYSLAPVGIWLFNRPDGPQIITRSSSRPFNSGRRSVATEHISLAPSSSAPSVLGRGSVAGTWQNEYGSLMTLSVSGQNISGVYQSSTGSTGLYEVVGHQINAAATQSLGQPVALAIEWHSIGEGSIDPSWNWASGLYGQISLMGAEEVLTLSHVLVASSDFPGLAKEGTYVDKLTYRRSVAVQHEVQHTAPPIAQSSKNTLAGTWIASDGTCLNLRVEEAREALLGRIHGSLSQASNQSEIVGFTDINAAKIGLSCQSVAITSAHKNNVLTLCGTLQLKDDVLELMLLTGEPTAPTHAYVQTRMSALKFRRMG